MHEMWDWLNANAGGIGVLATIITALIAAFALNATARDSRERTRPSLAAELFPALKSSTSIGFRVFNYGPTVARDVTVTFDPPIGEPAEDDPMRHVKRRYAQPIAQLSPGQALGNVWQTFAIQGKTSSAPDNCTVTIQYTDGRRKYLDSFVLNLDAISNESESTASNSELGCLRRIATATENLAKQTG